MGLLDYIADLFGDDSKPPAGKEYKNPHRYDLDPYLEVDPALVSHTETGSFPVTAKEPRVMATDMAGKIWIGGSEELVRYGADGTVEVRIPFTEPVTAVCPHADSPVYAACGKTIFKTGRGKAVPWIALDEQAHVTSLAVIGSGVFAADAVNRVIRRLDGRGTVTGTIGRKDPAAGIPGLVIPSPFFDIRADGYGSLWAANTGRRSLEKYSPAGALTASWGMSSFAVEGFCGCCNPAHFYIDADGGFVTAEKGLVRVKKYSPAGKLVSVIAAPTAFAAGTPFVDIAPGPAGSVLVLDPKQKKVRKYEKRNA